MQNGNYLEDFNNITNWTAFTSSGGELVPNHSHWGIASVAPVAVPTGPNVNGFLVYSTGSSGGVQKFPAAGSNSIAMQVTGSGSGATAIPGSNAIGMQLYLDFRNRIAGTVNFDWAMGNNPTGGRRGTFRLFAIDAAGTAWQQVGSDIVVTNGVTASGNFGSVALPSHFNYNQNARLLFYFCNADITVGTGNRPKIVLDNVAVTSTPCTPTKLVVTSLNSGNCPVVGVPFNTVVQSQAATNDACAVTANTNLSLTVNTGTGSLAGTTTTTLNAATFQNTFTFTGLTYDAAETGVSLNIARTSGNVLTAGNSATFEVIAATASEPTTQGTVAAGTPAFNSIALTLTPGNGGNRIVVAKAGSAVTTAPTDATPYAANSIFGSGATTAAGEFVVYNGNGTNVTVTGLTQGVTYHFATFEYNGTGCALNYRPNLTGIVNAATPVQTLAAGDIAMVQLRGESPDGFGFVALTDIGGGTQIRFTDCSWTGTAFVVTGTETNVEYVWTSPISTGGIPAGTVVNLQGGLTSVGTFTDGLGSAVVITGISNGGDQIFAYRGTFASPTFISGVTSAAYITTGVATAGNSYRPAGLAGDLATELTYATNNNNYFNITNICGTPATIRANIANQNNWFGYGNFNVAPIQIFQDPSFFTFNIVGGLAAEPTTSASAASSNLQPSSITLNLGVGNGNGRLVIAKLTSNATNAVPSDGIVYSANSTFLTSTSQIGSTGNYVVYAGSGTSVTVTALSPLTSYTFTVYEYNDVPCVNYKATTPGTVAGTTTELRYYSKSTQKANLQNLSAWSITPNELGASPADFTTPGISYVIDDANSTIGAGWSVGGASTRVIVDYAASLTVPAAFSLTTAGGAGVNVGAGATLTLQNAILPNLVTIDSTNSNVNFDMAGTVTIPAKTYCNLRFQNGTKDLPVGTGANGVVRLDNSVIVNGNFVVDAATINPAGAPFSFFRCRRNVTSINSSVWGSVGDVVTLLLEGNNNQTISKIGAGPDMILFRVTATKAGGDVILTSGTNINNQQDFDMLLSGTARFFDNGSTINVGDDLRLQGAANQYVLTGTFNFTNLVNDNSEIEDGSNQAPLAVLNNVTIAGTYISGTTEFRFRPTSGSGIINIKGGLNITNTSAIVNLYGNNIQIGGSFVNNSTAIGSLIHGTSTITLNGTSAQTVQTLVPNEIYNNIVINNNVGGVTFANPFTLTGNMTNNGNLTLGSNSVTFSGTATQTINGPKRVTFSDLNINTTAGTGLTVGSTGRASVTGTVTFGAAADLTVNAGGEFRLVSTGTGTARIANTAAGTVITGNVTSERFVPSNGWHLTGTALGSQTIVDWNDDLATQGPMPGVETPNPGANTSTIFEFDQTYNVNSGTQFGGIGEINGWKVPTTSDLFQNKGYRVFMPAGVTLDNTGSYSIGSKVLTCVSTGGLAYQGYNLFVNPHLSGVLRTGFTLGGGVQNTIVVWNQSANQYQYEGTAVTGASVGGPNPIASGQGFFMFSTTNGATVTIPETAKTTGGTFVRTNTAQNAVEIQLKNNSGQMDAALFQFLNDAEAGYDTKYDAHKMMNPGMNLYSINNAGNRLAINGLPFGGEQMVMPLGFNTTAGSYTLNFVGLDIMNDASDVFLKDNETGAIIDLNQNSEYAFVVAQAGQNDSRFELIFTNAVTSVNTLKNVASVAVYPNPVSTSNFTVATANLSGKVTVEVLDVLGRKVDSKVFETLKASTEIQINKPTVAGQYSVKVTDAKGSVVKSLIVK